MRILAALIALYGLVFITGCQATSVDAEAPTEVISTPASPPLSTPVPDSLSQEGDTTQRPPSLSTPDASGMQSLIEKAKEDLARRLSISVVEINLVEAKSVVWRDASLGCPKPGIDYIRVETPGYGILLETSGKTYNYHTDEVKRVILCNK